MAASSAAAVYKLKITLCGVKPPVWRRIEVLGDTTLPRLSRIIQAAMGWNDSHLHVFNIRGTQYGVPAPELCFADERRVRLEQIVGAVRQRFTYLYDFGDDWLHNVVVESITTADASTTYPRFIDGREACPPDDVGGVPGHDSFREVMANPSHPDYAEMNQWVGGRFDAGSLDAERIEAAFRTLARRS